MTGMDIETGHALSGAEHLRQSIGVLLSTPIGSLPGLRDYGSRLPSLVDEPASPTTLLLVQAATVEAIILWEPRVTVTAVRAAAGDAGIEVEIEGVHRETTKPFVLRTTGRSYSASYGASYE